MGTVSKSFVILPICLFILFSSALSAQTKNHPVTFIQPSNSQTPLSEQTLANINNITSWIRRDGWSGRNPNNGNSGVIYPRGTAGVIFQDGIIWGGIVQDTRDPSLPQLRVGGQTYFVGTQPGHIVIPGTDTTPPIISDMNQAYVYRIRKDWQSLGIGDSVVIRDAAELNDIDESQVTTAMQQEVLDQYASDWNSWPVDLGAPFIDNNNNGVYDPGIDEPGIANADQVIWLVVNDLIERITPPPLFYGSPPIGLELQITIWGYNTNDTFGHATYRRYRLINKSGFQIDSMFVSLWSDPDVGTFTNDFAGCDSTLDLGFAYNGSPSDDQFQQFGLAPAATGYALLQGPIVSSPGDTAIFNFQKIASARNLPMTSFAPFVTGDAVPDPVFEDYDGTKQWYNLLKGFTPTSDLVNLTPYVHGSGPNAGQPTRFPLNGDPLFQSGDVDGVGSNFPPGDRRMVVCSGPFDMQPGDTQEVVIALVGGISTDHLTSVAQLKQNVQFARDLQNNLFANIPTPVLFNAQANYRSPNETQVRFRAENADADSMRVFVYQQNGASVASLPLFDDGLHHDDAAGDGVFGNLWQTTPVSKGLLVDVLVYYRAGFNFRWEKLEQHLTTSGPVKATQIIIGSDNLNEDGVINPGENIRYTILLDNATNNLYSNVYISQLRVLNETDVIELQMPNGAYFIPDLSPGAFFWTYDPAQPYFQCQLLDSYPPGDSLRIVIQFADGAANRWINTVAVNVEALTFEPEAFLMDHVSGPAFGELGYLIVDPAQLKGHDYRVTFNSGKKYSLNDLTTGQTVLQDQPYPDPLHHNSVVVDGFQITRGTTISQDDIGRWDWFSDGPRWLSGRDWGGRVFFGSIDIGSNSFFGSNLDSSEFNSVNIVFDSSMITNCATYRRDLGYLFSGIGTFYGAAYDISDTLNPRRVNIVFVENETPEKPADLIWNPDTSLTGSREYLFIMDSDYDPVTAGGYDGNNWGPAADVVWAFWPKLRGSHLFLESLADFFLYISFAPSAGDVFEFTPQVTGIEDLPRPLTFELRQNYPNPFNPETQIRFSIPQLTPVTLEIFNVLGQRVKTLVDQKMSPGRYELTWDGRNNAGQQTASGVYFYRLKAGDFVKSRKMILLR